MNRYEVIFIDKANEYNTIEYQANDLRGCLEQFNGDYKHEVDLACIHEYVKGYYKKVFKFKISNDHLEYFMNEAKKKAKHPNQKVEIVSMKPGRKRKDDSSNESSSSGCGCLILIAIGYAIYKFVL